MRKLFLATVVAIALTPGGGLLAADIPVKPVYKAAPVAVAPAPFNWTGFYIGGHLGYGWAKPTVTDPNTGADIADPLPRPTGILAACKAA